MNDQDNSASGVRRVTPKDRKPSLATGGLQFPSEDDNLPDLPSEEERFPPLPPEPKRRGKSESFPPDVAPPVSSTAPTPMTESEKRFPDLANFPVEASPLPFDDFDDSPPVITPPEERFPPLPTSTDFIDSTFVEPLVETDLGDVPDILAPPKKKSRGGSQNAIAIFFLLAAIVVFAVGMLIYFNPYGPLNPFPPATPPPIYVTATFAAPAAIPGATATFTPLPVAVLTEMAPARTNAESAAPAPTSLPASVIDATAIAPTPGGLVGGG